ncbi:MAG: FAD-dependent oxidoreductase [Candidatus Omnitrophica bacterium]|nr:FAD-dependent oxidoreductase [Candidatus Omnitrophota bacterium]MDD5236562.1 FAD-dependent oxidoreductase [Candidatus Omnitrophota bacterium]MDD5610211.1 FAD-dependent oxidoreductase [Candidatus Omnitrophota bacterium]
MTENIFDLIVIGAGPAGITASIYAVRKRMKLLVITKDIGGQTAISGDVENYTGYQFITGPDLTQKFEEHLRKFGIDLKEGEEVLQIQKEGELVRIKTDKGEYVSRTLIIASGKRSRQLNVPGEKEFKNKGLTYCATCDAPLFQGKDVAVIGGGNSALDAALQLIKIAKKVYIINNTPALGADAIMREKAMQSSIVTIFNNAQVLEITGDSFVKALKMKENGKERILPVEGIFVEIGLLPNTGFAREIERNQYEEIKVNNRNETNIPGIFAAGDVTDVPEKQIIIAAGEGSKASLSAFKYLMQHKF